MDSKLESMRASISTYREEESGWTPYNRSLERSLLNKQRFLSERESTDVFEGTPEATDTLGKTQDSIKSPDDLKAKSPEGQSLFGNQLQSALDTTRSEE